MEKKSTTAQRLRQIMAERNLKQSDILELARFHKLLRRNGLPPYTIHSLRHAFAAIMHAQGIPDKYVMRAGGWSSDYVLKDIYQYTFDSEAAKAEEKANKYFSRIVDATRNATRNKKV